VTVVKKQDHQYRPPLPTLTMAAQPFAAVAAATAALMRGVGNTIGRKHPGLAVYAAKFALASIDAAAEGMKVASAIFDLGHAPPTHTRKCKRAQALSHR
jgi:hypothetical protein